MAAKSLSFFLLLLLAISIAAPKSEAITCNDVTNGLYPCLNYVMYGTAPTGTCCGGIKSLLSRATGTPDRRNVCNCLKGIYAQYERYVDPNMMRRATALPGSCGVNIPYVISPNIDCSTVN